MPCFSVTVRDQPAVKKTGNRSNIKVEPDNKFPVIVKTLMGQTASVIVSAVCIFVVTRLPYTVKPELNKYLREAIISHQVLFFSSSGLPLGKMRLCHRVSSVARHLSTIHKKCFSSRNSCPISILFGLFERACACA